MWTILLKQGVVMSAPLNMLCLVYDQAVFVHGYLSLDGVLFLFATVMRFPLKLGLWPWKLLLRCVQEGFEAWKNRFDFIERSQPPDFLVELLWQRQSLTHQWFKHSNIF